MHLIYKQLHLYINLYIKKNVFLLGNNDLCSISTFQIKSSFEKYKSGISFLS